MNQRSKALVLSYSPVERDPRVLRQMKWLSQNTENKLEISAFGIGNFDSFPFGTYTPIEVRAAPIRLMSYMLLPHTERQKLALSTFLKSDEIEKIKSGVYRIIILNDLDFVGLDVLFDSARESKTPIFIDLHEYFYDLGGSFLFRLLNGRYYNWLLAKLEKRSVEGLFTVSEAIADLYRLKLSNRPAAVMNVPDFKVFDSKATSEISSDPRIRLVYHGVGGTGRGLLRVIRAMRQVRKEYELHLVLVGTRIQKLTYMLYCWLLGVRERVIFHEPVAFHEIGKMLQSFDVQVMFFHPPHSTSINYSLPNKFFESASAGLAIVVGPSPSMKDLVEKYDAGWVSSGWSYLDLASTINSLSHRDLLVKKNNSKEMARELSESSQRERFLTHTGLI